MQTVECDAKIYMYVRLELSTVQSVANFIRYDTIAAHEVWLLLVVQQGNGQSYADLFQFKSHTRTVLQQQLEWTFSQLSTHNPTLCTDPRRIMDTLNSMLVIIF